MKFALTILSLLTLTLITTTLDTWAVNRVLSLDGAGDYVEIPHSDSLNITKAMTIEGWVFHKDAETVNEWAQAWVSKYLGGPVSWDIHSDGFFISRDGREDDMIRFVAPKDEWFHIACVYDGKKQGVYINGILAAEREWPGSIASSNSPVQIGTHGGQYWPGMVDEVRIWNIARTHEEILSAMNAPLTGDEPGLAAYWNFADGAANDLSPNGNHGAAGGSAQIIAATLPDSFVPANAVGVENKVVNPGKTFTTNISVGLAEPLYRFTFDLKFDPAILTAVSIKEGDFLSRSGADATAWENPQVDNEKGVITNIRCYRTTNIGVERKMGILAVATFEAKKAGSSEIRVENLGLVGANDVRIKAYAQAGTVDIFPHGGLSGAVIDADDQTPISGARVEVSNRWLRLRHVYSDREGKYTLNGVPVGNVNLKVVRGRAYSNIATQVHVKPGEMKSDFNLELKPVPLPEIPAPGEEPTPTWEDDEEEEAEEDL